MELFFKSANRSFTSVLNRKKNVWKFIQTFFIALPFVHS